MKSYDYKFYITWGHIQYQITLILKIYLTTQENCDVHAMYM